MILKYFTFNKSDIWCQFFGKFWFVLFRNLFANVWFQTQIAHLDENTCPCPLTRTDCDSLRRDALDRTAGISGLVAVVPEALVNGPCFGHFILKAVVVNVTHPTSIKLCPSHAARGVTARRPTAQLTARLAARRLAAHRRHVGGVVLGYNGGNRVTFKRSGEHHPSNPYNVSVP